MQHEQELRPLYACPLCGTDKSILILEIEDKTYWQCPECKLCFQHRNSHLPPTEEKKRYDLHENDPADPAYRKFLSKLFNPMLARLEKGWKGLDFGSGPGPTLNVMFEEKDFEMEIYDIFYENNPAVFQKSYDFITATEVVEHLSEPGKELQKLWNCLNPGGYLGIMTKRMVSAGEFKNWHYRKDDTHITFFAMETFKWLAQKWNGTIDYTAPRVVILKKSNAGKS